MSETTTAEPLAPALSWFAARGWQPFEYQIEVWRAYLEEHSGLVHAPTGMGKTYAVWMGPVLESLATPNLRAAAGKPSGLRVLWITPLRALANDVAGALVAPLMQMGSDWTVEVRTGDTTQAARKRQRERLPSALVTTPESLSLLLSYPDGAERLGGLRCVVVDEWHELMGTKRGVQTELALARLRGIAPSLRTWGLSATIGNLDQAMDVLMGSGRPARHRSLLVQGPAARPVEVVTLLPESVERFPWAGHLGLKLLPTVVERLEKARTTLLFTNTRSQAEIWFQELMRARPDWLGHITVHHGSIDRQLRGRVEAMARAGTVRCVVCTSSLDLGVDFAPVDQVIQIGSPKGVARLLQRAGRSGHQPGGVSRIYGVPTNAFEMVEFAAARDAVQAGDGHPGRRDCPEDAAPIRDCGDGAGIGNRGPGWAAVEAQERPPLNLEEGGPDARPPGSDARVPRPLVETRVPLELTLDVLVQHLVTVALGGGFAEPELFEEVRRTHAFAKLTPEQWRWAMEFVTQGGPTLSAYPQYMRVARQDGRCVVPDARLGRLHRMSIGTIASDDVLRVKVVRGATLGTIEESFIARLKPGDRFVFSGHVLELARVRDMTAWVRRTKLAGGVVPRWQGGAHAAQQPVERGRPAQADPVRFRDPR